MHSIISVRRHEVSFEVGVDSQGILLQFKNYSGQPLRTSSFRPTEYSANLLVGSLIKALEGGPEYQRFEFESIDKLKIRGQFQEVQNNVIGVFKRFLVIIEPTVNRHSSAGTAYIVVMRDSELIKLKTFLIEAYELKI